MALVGILFFLIFIIVAIRLGIAKQKQEAEQENQTVIHTSGIYSIVRKSPREDIGKIKPSIEEIHQYLTDQNVDIHGKKLGGADKETLINAWKTNLENTLLLIDNGDKKGHEFYYYDFKEEDDVCKNINKGNFITRQDIFKHPQLIPPFHLGCRCTLKSHQGTDDLRDTTLLGMNPFISENGAIPPLPEWKKILKL